MDTNRLKAFSDGVIAIAITLFVLEIKAPRGELGLGLLHLWPSYLAYAISFIVIGAAARRLDHDRPQALGG